MQLQCPKCSSPKNFIRKSGRFYRRSDSRTVQRYLCKCCKKHFSQATFSACYRQKKRRLNGIIKASLCSAMSMRRLARIYGASRLTIKRKKIFLAAQARLNQDKWRKDKVFSEVQFDELETFEHSKCKPITVMLFVNEDRKIIDFGVAPIGAKGKLVHIARKKYGKRKNRGFQMREELCKKISPHIHPLATLRSDQNPNYKPLIKKHFPLAKHECFLGTRGCVTAQGELKKIKFDPIFKINHAFAMLRANINRLLRKTWCTTKDIKRLEDHIAIYVDYHNKVLT